MGDRIEVIIERWGSPDKSVEYRWSVWRGGARVEMGGPHRSAEESERDAVAFCRKRFDRAPERIERL
jgi:hypothetical protein